MADQKKSAPKYVRNAKRESLKGASRGDLELYRTIAEHMAEGVSIVVGDERVYVNPAYLRIHGLTEASQALGKSMGLFMDVDSQKTVKDVRDARLRGEDSPTTIEYRIQRPDGEQRVLEVAPAAITYEGKPATLALIRDVTARTYNAEQLRMAGIVAENMAEGVSVAVGTERVYVNKAFLDIFGLQDESEVIGQSINQFIVPEDKERVAETWLARQRGEQVPDWVEYRIRRLDGVERVMETSTATITYQNQPAVLGIIRDITDRRTTEDQLAQSVKLYQALFDHVPVGIGIADMEGNLITFNEAMLQPGGYTKEDILKIGNVAHLYADPKERAESLRLASEQGYLLHHEVQFKRKDGTNYDASLSLSPVTINGQPCWQAMVEDITERKRAREELRLSEELYRSLAENMAEGLSISVDGSHMYVNKALADIYGVADPSQLIGEDLGVHLAPEDRQRALDRTLARQRGETLPPASEYRILRVDGEERLLEVATAQTTYQGQLAVLALIRDTTEQRHAQKALQQSEELYRNVAENMAEGVSIAVDGQRIYANKALLDIYGLDDLSQAIGKGIEEFMVPEEREQARKEGLARQNGDPVPSVSEHRVTRSDGAMRIIEVTGTPITYQGQAAVLSIIRDVTEARQVAAALEQSEDLYRSVAENMTDGVSIAANGIRLYANQAFLNIHGLQNVSEAVGKGIESFFTPGYQSSVLERQQTLEAGEGVSLPVGRQIQRPDGQVRDVEVVSTPITYRGEPAFLSIYRDVTDRKRAEEETMASRQQAVEALEELKAAQQSLVQAEKLSAIGQLVAGVAHELNNPLTGVMGFSQLLLDTDISGNVRRDVERISSEAGRAAKIVQNLLSFARKREPEATPVDLNQVVKSTVEVKAYDLRTSSVAVKTDLAADLPLILADTSQMQTVLLNLVGNAQDAMGHPGGGGMLQISTRQVGDTVRVTVADNGPGIRPEHVGKVFDPFFTTKDVGEGTGLGLSICHGIVTAHDGRIWAESELGQGAAFYVEMPMAAGAGLQIAEAEEKNSQLIALKGRVLVVDDEQVIRYLVTSALSQAGCEVRAAESGKKALELLEQVLFDLLIVDLKMPEMSGERLFQELRRTQPKMVARVLFMTGDMVSPDTVKFLDGTGRPAIAKPFSVEALKQAVADELEKTGLRQG